MLKSTEELPECYPEQLAAPFCIGFLFLHLWLSVFLVLVILVSVKWYIDMGLISILPQCQTSFHVLFGHSYIFLGEIICQFFHWITWLFFFFFNHWVFFFNALWIPVSYQIGFANIFSQFVWIFTFLMVSFEEGQKFLISIKLNLPVSIMSCAFGIICKNSLPNPRSLRFAFSSESFVVLSFTFRTLLHFKLIFLYCQG